jgi:hypothetical protein
LTAIVSSASTCSVTRIVPSSVHIAEQARIVTIRPVKTGASSRVIVSATVGPTMLSALKSWNARADWWANTIPEKVPVRQTIRIEPTPTKSSCPKRLPSRYGGRTAQRNTCTPSVATPPRSVTPLRMERARFPNASSRSPERFPASGSI